MTKSAEAFRTISEVAEVLATPAHVLRFWESRFTQIRPVKRAGGRRYYRPADVALLGGIKRLLHEDGLTIRGVQKILREHGVRHVAQLSGLTLEAAPDLAEAVPHGAGPAITPPATGAWPEAPTPDPAAEALGLQADPDDLADAEEAPFLLDAPLLPAGGSGSPHPLFPEPRSARTTATGADADEPGPVPAAATGTVEADAPQPAAAMLRAMDAVRAQDKQGELRSVFTRLTRLRDRLARESKSTARPGQD